VSKRRFARSGQTDRHAASVVDTDETLVSDDIRGEHRGEPARGWASAVIRLLWPGSSLRAHCAVM
jgi:hypothetical protein